MVIRRFNLLIEGTGVRYNLRPQRSFFADSRRLAFFAAFGISALVIGYIALQNRNALTSWELFPQEKLDIWIKIPVAENPAQTDTQKKKGGSGRKRIVLDESGMVVSSSNVSLPLSANPGDLTSATENLYLVRFAVCLLKQSAESLKKELVAKGVESAIHLEERKMSFYRLKIGPFPDSIAREKALRILKELSIPVLAPSSAEDKTMATDDVWLKSRVGKARKRLEAISVGVKVSTGRKTKAVFKVISSHFDDRPSALRQLEKWRKKKIDGVLEKVKS